MYHTKDSCDCKVNLQKTRKKTRRSLWNYGGTGGGGANSFDLRVLVIEPFSGFLLSLWLSLFAKIYWE